MRLSDYSRTDGAALLMGDNNGRDQARFHARASIDAGTRSDRVIIARAALDSSTNAVESDVAGASAVSAELRDLKVVYARKLTRAQFKAAKKHNQELLAAAMAGALSSDRKKTKQIRLRALVRNAQRLANAWLQRNKLKLSDVGITKKKKRGCGGLLCVDGILGNNTKTVLIAISERDSAFLRPKPQ